jgi:hypothetical protein
VCTPLCHILLCYCFLYLFLYFFKFQFPFKLHQLLEDAANEDNESIVSWLPDGKAFKIHCKSDFETQIIPRYYVKNKNCTSPKYRSFLRQLSIYGFKKQHDGGVGYYFHPLLIRGQPELCTQMVRHAVKQQQQDDDGIIHDSTTTSGGIMASKNKTTSSNNNKKKTAQQETYCSQQQEGSTTSSSPQPAALGPLDGLPPRASNSSSTRPSPVFEGGSLFSHEMDEEDDLLGFAIQASEYLAAKESLRVATSLLVEEREQQQFFT